MATEVVLRGAVDEDGYLVLDGKPGLPPGRVEVIVRPVEDAPLESSGLLDVLEPIWAELDAGGAKRRTIEEAVADVRALRDEWEVRQEKLEEFREQVRARRREEEG